MSPEWLKKSDPEPRSSLIGINIYFPGSVSALRYANDPSRLFQGGVGGSVDAIARTADDAARSGIGPLTLDGVTFRHPPGIQRRSIRTAATRGRREKPYTWRTSGAGAVLAALTLIFMPPTIGDVAAQTEITPIQFVGLSYVSDAKSIPLIAPRIHKLTQDREFSKALYKRLNDGLAALQRERPDLQLTSQFTQQADDTYMLSFSIVAEVVDYQDVGSIKAVNYDLQVLVFVGNISKDQQRQRVVTSYPIRIRLSDAREPDHSPDREIDVYRRLLLAPPKKLDILSLWVERAKSIKLREKNVWLSVPQLTIAEPALNSLALADADRLLLALRATTTLEAQISEKFNIPVIPAGPGATTDRMVLSLANADSSYTFKLAEPDYQIGVELLRTVTTQNQGRSAHGNVLITKGLRAAGFHVKVMDVDKSKPVADGFFRRVSEFEYAGTRSFKESEALANEISVFHHEFGQWLAAPTPEWAKKSRSDQEKRSEADVVKVFSAFSDRLKRAQ